MARALSTFLVSFLAAGTANVFLDLSLDARTFAFAALLSVLTCLVFAAVPVVRAARTQPAGALASGGRSGTSGRERAGVRRALLASQIALSLALLMGTLLFARSLRSLETLDAGFQQHGMLIASVSFSGLQLPADRAAGFRKEILERVRSTPAVDAAAEVVIVPLAGGNWNNRVWMDGSDAQHARVVFRNMIGTEFFRTSRTALVAGREFDERDLTPSAPKVAVVNEAFARAFAAGPQIVGQRLWLEPTPSEPSAAYEIVGLVKNTKYRDLREDFKPVLFVPLSQAALRSTVDQLVIRSRVPAEALVPSLRATLDGVSPKMRYSFRVFDTVVQGVAAAGTPDGVARRPVRRAGGDPHRAGPVRRDLVHRGAAHERDRHPDRAGGGPPRRHRADPARGGGGAGAGSRGRNAAHARRRPGGGGAAVRARRVRSAVARDRRRRAGARRRRRQLPAGAALSSVDPFIALRRTDQH